MLYFFLLVFSHLTNNRVRNPPFVLLSLTSHNTYQIVPIPALLCSTVRAAISSAWGVAGDGDIWTEGGDSSATIDATKQRPPRRHAPLASHFSRPPPRCTDYYNVSSLLSTDVCVLPGSGGGAHVQLGIYKVRVCR